MKIVQINTFSNKSTGHIMMGIHEELLKLGHDSFVIWGRGRKSNNKNEFFLNDKIGVLWHAFLTRLTDRCGFFSRLSTKKIIKILKNINPDVIHLHNLHGYYINVEMLFKYIKSTNVKVVWTLHDCWSFTGHCSHFESIGCCKWMNECNNCCQLKMYPKSIIDNSKKNYLNKKRLFTKVPDLTIVTPSKWLANLVGSSFLKDYSRFVINNGINPDIFKYRDNKVKEKYNITDKIMILGVASDWTKEKGLDDFFQLANCINEKYSIMLVGLSKTQMKSIPSNIIGIERTSNAVELAELYSAADVYLNLTYADTYPTTNLESLACGTPVVTYRTGGSVETVNKYNGYITDHDELLNSFDNIINSMLNLNFGKKYVFKEKDKFREYIKLYGIEE